jgi:uncharacterized membrane protein YhaH (DUF805 family)
MFSKYFTFEGRATRSEFWWFFLFYCLATAMCELVAKSNTGLPLVYSTAIAGSIILWVAFISKWVRRLRDAGFSVWWVLAPIVPLVLAMFPTKPEAESLTPEP